ncbi:unnamed protein product [Zymoseptoria tritici ST99CH_1E4]|uniref:Cupin 2 conserved barrel domain-containing protein n=1 Tax=Zymoseptoria tritici ST99CH_1E4 TaxID=1276532 RepID=A0A2H1H8N7_ZYMTR|nr:unnamed protein product [Zymoseptoria tritici ST99CH_1E4]
MSSAGAKGLRLCKRYITTHNSAGKSIYADSPAQVYNYNPGFGGMARSYSVGSVPAVLTADADVEAYRSDDAVTSYKRRDIVLPQPGSNLVVVDLEPGASSQMHQTVSIDYSICVIGEIDHELDGGEVVRLYPGDHVIQRGTMHRWTNASKDKPARFVACSLPCEPFDVGGKMLKEVHLPREKKAKL